MIVLRGFDIKKNRLTHVCNNRHRTGKQDHIVEHCSCSRRTSRSPAKNNGEVLKDELFVFEKTDGMCPCSSSLEEMFSCINNASSFWYLKSILKDRSCTVKGGSLQLWIRFTNFAFYDLWIEKLSRMIWYFQHSKKECHSCRRIVACVHVWACGSKCCAEFGYQAGSGRTGVRTNAANSEVPAVA